MKITLYEDEYTKIICESDEILDPEEQMGILGENELRKIEENKANKHKEIINI